MNHDHRVRAVLLFACLLAFGALVLRLYRPPAPLPETAPAESFSAARAEPHLARIAAVPHPVGSDAHDAVAAYLQDTLTHLGFTVDIQEGLACEDPTRPFLRCGRVHNVLATLPGSDPDAARRAVLLATHYDGVYAGPGAGDSAAAVAALLEAGRALTVGPRPKHDILLLFTDSEEYGLLGSALFVSRYPELARVDTVLNFDARGSSGPVLMFETGARNAAMIRALREAAPHPFANSLSGEIYDRMTNLTDFTIFKNAGMRGLNFAFIDHVENYHTQRDTLAHLDRGTVQHHGETALALARYFGNAPPPADAGNAVYFNPIGSVLVAYPVAWTWPLTVAVLALWALTLRRLHQRAPLGAGHVLAGAGAALAIWLVPALVAAFLWPLLMPLFPAQQAMPMHTYHSRVFWLLLLPAQLGWTVWAAGWAAKKWGRRALALGGLLPALLLLVAASLAMPGAAWLLLYPAGAACLAAWADPNAQDGRTGLLAALAAGAVTLALFVPVAYALLSAFPIAQAAACIALVGLGLTTLLSQAAYLATHTGRWVPLACALLTVAAVPVIRAVTAFSPTQPAPGGVFYALDAGAARAVVGTLERPVGTVARTALGPDTVTDGLPGMLLTSMEATYREAPVLPLTPPTVTLVDTGPSVHGLRLDFEVAAGPDTARLVLRAEARNGIRDATVGGIACTPSDDGLAMRYTGKPDQLGTISLVVAPGDTVTFRVMAVAYHLPEALDLPLPPPDQRLSHPHVPYQYTTHVTQTFSFDTRAEPPGE